MKNSALALRAMAKPRAVIGSPRADAASAAEVLQGLQTSVTNLEAGVKKDFKALEKVVADFRAANDEAAGKTDTLMTEKVDRINSAIDEGKAGIKATQDEIAKVVKDVEAVTNKMAGFIAAGGSAAAESKDPRISNEHFPAYQKAFNSYFRRGGDEHALRDLEVKATMTIGSNPDGGYTVLPEVETAIDSVVKQVSPMRDIASVMTIGTSEYKKLVNVHGTASGWVGERDSRPQTAGSQLDELKFPVMEVYAMPAASQSLLDDSYLDIAAWLSGEVQLEFAQKEGNAFINGTGVMQPAGFIGGYSVVANASYAFGKIGYIASGADGAFASTGPADCLIDAYHALQAAYRANSTFVANRKSLGAIRKLKDGQGNYLLNMVLRPEAFVEEILGRPAVEMPDMPDIGSNSLSVAVGDFQRGYLIVDRVGIRVLRDAYTSKPYVLFYTTKRVGGGVQNFEAIKLVKFATS